MLSILHWCKFLSRCCFPIFICDELGVSERLCDPSSALLTQGCPAGPVKALCFYKNLLDTQDQLKFSINPCHILANQGNSLITRINVDDR